MTERTLRAMLAPFMAESALSAEAASRLLVYLELLERWNARTNLTAVRDREHIVTRHFGESLFAASVLLQPPTAGELPTVADVGSGAGFPGLPMKVFRPDLDVTLIESHGKKATFLREAVRTMKLDRVRVAAERAEQHRGSYGLVTLRAVEKFHQVLPVASRLVGVGGRIGLLIGQDQVKDAMILLPGWNWKQPEKVPESANRVVLAGEKPSQY